MVKNDAWLTLFSTEFFWWMHKAGHACVYGLRVEIYQLSGIITKLNKYVSHQLLSLCLALISQTVVNY